MPCRLWQSRWPASSTRSGRTVWSALSCANPDAAYGHPNTTSAAIALTLISAVMPTAGIAGALLFLWSALCHSLADDMVLVPHGVFLRVAKRPATYVFADDG